MNPELSNRQYFIKNSSLCNLPLSFFNFLYDISIIKTKSRQSRAISLNQRQVLYLIFYIYCNSIVIPVLSNFFASVDLPAPAGPHIKITLLFDKSPIEKISYFMKLVGWEQLLDDLNLIIRDIRETHKKDSESAPQTTVADELKENLKAVENFKGSRDEKLVVLYCKHLGINYKNLSDEEFRWLIRILKKSKKMGTPISQRKKR